MSKKYIGCTIKQLPNKELERAAQFACSLNPANAPPSAMLAKFGMVDKLAIAVMTSKYFGPEGIKLSVSFLENTSAALAEKILSHLNAWNAHANIRFDMYGGAAANAEVRISRGPGGYYSYLGTDVLRIQRGRPTMNLEGFSLNTSEAEYKRVVHHEAGHTCGCPHEHMRAEIVNRLDVRKTIAYFQRTQGWTAQEVQQQVLTPISEASVRGTLHAEDTSIMCYGLPASITKDGRAIPGGRDITPTDGEFMGKVYPKAIIPPVEPPTPAAKLRITLDVDPQAKTGTIVSIA